MRRLLLSLLAVFMVTLSVHSAAQVVLSEGFENGIPSGWTDTAISYQSASYIFHWDAETESTYLPTGAPEGVYRAAIRNTNSRSRTCVTRLITPVMDCAIYRPRLIFAHAQPVKGTKAVDSLMIYYRTSPTGDWTLLKTYSDRIDVWQYDTLDLIGGTSTYQLAFEANISNGNGIVIDDITIAAAPQCTDVQSIGVVAMANSAEVTIGADLSAESFQVVVSETAITDWDNYDPSTAVYYNPLLEDFSVIVPNLLAQTDYYVYVRSACADMASGYTSWVEQTFRTSLGFPMTEEFATGIPTDWSRMQSKLADAYSGQPLRSYTSSTYGWQKATNTTITGSTHVYAYAYMSSTTPDNYDPFWLVSPGIDLTTVPNDTAIEMTFSLELTTSSTGTTAVAATGVGNLQFTVLVSEDDGATWSAGNATVWSSNNQATYQISQINGKLQRVRINMNRYKGKVIRLAFVAQTSSTSGYFHMDEVSIHSYDAQCGDVLKVTAQPAVTSITANWTISGKENATIELSSDENFTTIEQTAQITTGTTYTFTNLTQNTMYYIRVRQNCEGAAWVGTACRTAVGLPYLNPFVTTTIPADWTRHTGVSVQDVLNGQNLPAAVTSGWSYASTASAAFPAMTEGRIYASLSSTNKYWFVSPTIMMDDASNNPLRLSFLLAAAKSSSAATAPDFSDKDDIFAVLISDDAGLTWTQANATIWDCDTASANQKLYTFSEVPQRITVDMTAYRGKAVKVALYSGSTVAGATNYIIISNLSINTYDANCGGVRNLGIKTTSVSASATWTAVGNQAVSVQLSETSDFAELIDSLSTTGSVATFNNLMPHTHYYLRVRQTCTTDAVDWAVASFTTPYGVPFTEMFTASGVPSDWTRCIGVADSVVAGKERLTTTTSSYYRQWTKGSSTGTMYLQMYAYTSSSYEYYCKSWLVTPNLDMTGAGQTAQLVFNLAVSGSSSSMTSANANANENTFMVLGSTDDGATWFILRDWRNDGSSADRFSDIPNKLTRTVINLSQYTSGNLRLAFYGGTTSGVSSLYVHVNKVQVKSYDVNCQGIESVRATSITGSGATIEWMAGGTRSADILIATDTSFAAPVYNETVNGNAVVTGLESNTYYYVKARQSCDTVGEWMFTEFKTLCLPITPTALGTETFDNEVNMECWTLGYMDDGTISSTTSGRVNIAKYGNVLRLAKSSVNTSSTTYADRPYAISPEIDVDTISKYQVMFNACTNSTAATNIARVFVGIATDPSDLGSIEHIKTLNLNQASDSNASGTYVVSFADYEGDYNGDYGRFIVFVADAAPDSTNIVLIDNVSVESADGCQQLIETVMDSVATDMARMKWENSGATQYEVMVSPFGGRADTIQASSLVFQGVSPTNSININNLQGNTVYYAYVRGICTDDNNETTYSRWSSARRFKTLCTYVSQYPWTEGFEDYTGVAYNAEGVVPDCWDSYSTGTVTPHIISSGSGSYVYIHTGSNALTFYGSGNCYAILPPFDRPINQLEMTFWMQTESATNGTLTLGYILSGDNNMDTFTEIEQYENHTGSMIQREATLATVPAAASRLVFRWVYTSQWSVCIDDISVQPVPECRKPAFTGSSATLTSLSLNWINTGATNTYEIERSNAADFSTILDSIAVNDTLVTFSNLTPSTNYYFRVRSLCGEGEVSEWSNVKEVRTAIGVPYVETFNHTALPSDWTRYQGSVDSAYAGILPTLYTSTSTTYGWANYTSSYGLDANHLKGYIYYYSDSYQDHWLISPSIDLTPNVGDNITASFLMALTSSSSASAPAETVLPYVDIRFMVSADDGQSWTEANSWIWADSVAGAYASPGSIPADGRENMISLDLSRFAGQTIRVAFYFRHTGSTGSAYVHIGDFNLRQMVAGCYDPTNLVAGEPGLDMVDLSWEGDSTLVSLVEVARDKDFTLGLRVDTVPFGLNYVLSHLSPSSVYYVRVKQMCDSVHSTFYTNKVSFNTACAAITELPWTESFEAFDVTTNTDPAPACWEFLNRATTTSSYPQVYINNSSTYVKTGTKSLYFKSSSSTSVYAVLPEIGLPLNTLQLTFSHREESATSSALCSVGYITDVNNFNTFVELATFVRMAAWQTEEVSLAAIPAEVAESARLAFRYGGGTTSQNYYMGIDDIEIAPLPACPKVPAGAMIDITTNSATAVITTVDAPLYEFAVTNRAITNIDSSAVVYHTIQASDTLYVENLRAASNYYIYVRPLCDSTTVGEWSNPVNFATECDIVTLPFAQDFNGLSSGIPACWDNSEGTTTTDSYRWNYYAATDAACLRFNSYINSSGNTNILATPLILLSAPARLSFRCKNPTGGDFSVQVQRTDGTRVNVITSLTSITDWTTQQVDLSQFMGQTVKILFCATSNYGNGDAYLYLDDVEVVATGTSTATILSMSVDNVTVNSADVKLVVNPDTTLCRNYELVVSNTALTDSILDTIAKTQLGSVTTYTVTGLKRERTYYFYVRSACDSLIGEWLSAHITTKGLAACEDIVTGAGSTTTSTYLPTYSFYKYSFTQQIYTAEEIGIAGAINAITFHNSGANRTRDVDVYLSYTNKNSFADGDDWEDMGAAVLVYTGSLTFDAETTIPLGVPFQYDGIQNIMLSIDDNNGAYESSPYVTCATYATSGAQAIYKYNDATDYDPMDMSAVTGTTATSKNAVTFTICYALDPCPAVTNLTATAVGRGTTTFNLNWTATTAENLVDYDVYVGTVNPATLDSVPETYRHITDTTLALTTLTPATNYYAAVRANCNEDDGISAWEIIEFTTYATCPSIENLTIIPVSKTEVTATWEFGGPELDTVFNYVLSTTDSVDWSTAQPLQVNALTLDLTGLTAGQTYWLFVAQNCTVENSAYVSTTFTMPADCAPVENLTAVPSYNLVNLTWDRAAFGFETEWEVGIVGGTTQIVTEPRAMFYGLNAQTRYTAYVRAICTETDMSDSVRISFVTANEPQPCVAIGEGSGVVYTVPFDNFYKNAAVQTIYTVDQIAQAGRIESIQYNCSITAEIDEPLVMDELKIYMAHTTMDVAATTSSWVPENEATLVYSATNYAMPTTDGPLVFNLQTPFVYNGTDNLAIIITHKASEYESGIKFYYTAGLTGVTMYRNSDSDAAAGDYPATSSSTATVTRSTYQADITFCFPYEPCMRPQEVSVSDVTAHEANISWLPGGHEVSWNTFLSPVAMNDAALETAAYDTVTTLSKALTGLADDTDYHFYVRSICDSTTTSSWEEVIFTTVAICVAPNGLQTDSVTNSSAYIRWSSSNEGYENTSYIVAYGLTATFDLTDPATYQTMPATGNTLTLTGLSANTRYNFAVREVCDATYTSRWSQPATFLTACGVVTLFPWVEDFEDYTTGALTIPCWSNEQIVAGTGTSGSTGLLFQISGTTVSNNATKKLYLPDMKAGTKTQLTLPTMYIPVANEYEFDIEVLRNATSYDNEGLRIYVSTDGTLTNATELCFISRNYSVADLAHGIPAEVASGWYGYELNIPVADTLQIIIVGESQYGSATYADNFRVRRQPTCKRPVIVSATPTHNTVALTWTGGTDRDYQVEYDVQADFSTKQIVTVNADTTVTINGLTAATQYWFRVKGLCGDTAVSDYSTVAKAKTAYIIPFTENYSSSSIPEDWSRLQGDVTGTTSSTTSGWSFTSSSSNYYAYSYISYSSSTNARYTLTTPAIVMNTTEPGVRLSFDMSLATTSTGSTAPTATVSAGREFSIVVSTDNGATWTKVQTWSDSAYSAIPVDARNVKVDLSSYAGQIVKVGFYHSIGTSTNTSSTYIRVDNVHIAGFDNTCAGIEDLAISNPSTVGTVVTWTYGQGSQDAVIVVSTAASTDSAVIWTDTVRNAATVTLPTMPMSSTIHVFVKQICGGDNESAWSEVSFKTPIGVPYHPVFSSTTVPSDWTRSSTLAANIFAGQDFSTSTGAWNLVAGNEIMDGYHFKNNVYGTSKHDWVITPAIDMTPNVGQGILLSFDLMLCDWNYPGVAPEQADLDDNFMVVISEDGGLTWNRSNATLWQDTAGDYRYNDIPYLTTQTYRVDLSRYTGKVIKIGFYAESTATGADNDLHLGNIHVEQVAANMYTDSVCDGEGYQNYGFTITADQYHVGTNSFSNYKPATETAPAVLDVLTLEVQAIQEKTISAVVCENAAYYYDENVYVEEGEVVPGEQTITFYLTSKNGCDSIVYLQITGMPTSYTTEYAETCSGIPYNWHGQDYYLTGTYVDSLQTIGGCDSICTLLLTVQERLHSDTSIYLCYGDQLIIDGQEVTQSGVYTEYIDNPEGCDEELAWNVTVVGKLESHKRVVACKGTTYSDDLIQGLTTDYHGTTTTTSKVSGCDSTVIIDVWFAAAGETIYVNVPQNELPFYVNGIELVAAGTAEGEYTKTVATDCGDVIMVIAVGKAVNRYTVMVKAVNGIPYGDGVYVEGEQVEIGVRPFEGYKFKEWNDGNTDNPRTISVIADVTYTGTCVVIEDALEDVLRDMDEDDVLKLIENQQLIIIRNGVRYNAQGAVIE